MIKQMFAVAVVVGLFQGLAFGQTTPSGSNSGKVDLSPRVVERGPDHRVWQTYQIETNPRNETIVHTNSYTELQTGMHFKGKTGEWEESQEVFDLKPGKAVANRGRHAVSIRNNIHTAGSVEITLPDGQVIRTHPLGLSYYDKISGQSVLIAEVKDCDGVVVEPNQVLFSDAFTDFKADIRYTYTKAGIEQDIILREKPPGPEQWNLPPTTKLEMLTEFLDGPMPKVKGTAKADKKGKGKFSSQVSGGTNETTMTTNGVAGADSASLETEDEDVDWSTMRMSRGKAFVLGVDHNVENCVPVNKHFLTMEGRKILVEDVSWNMVSEEVGRLPKPQAVFKARKSKVQRLVSAEPSLPKTPSVKLSNKRMEVAAITPTQNGYVLDYMLQLSDYSGDYVFAGDTTYYVSGPVTLNNVTIEGGTVLKFKNTGSGFLSGGAWPVNCKTAPYRPAVFTSMDDNSVGETISGSSGNPTNVPGIYWKNFYGTLSYARFAYAGQAISGDWANLWDCQFVRCGTGVGVKEGEIDLYNVLFSSCSTGVAFDSYGFLFAQNVTADGTNAFASFTNLAYGVDAELRNCLFTRLSQNVTNNLQQIANQYGNSLVLKSVFQPTQLPYVSCGGGSYYLAPSTYQGVGVTDVDPALLAELRLKTTYPPTIYSNVTISTPLTLGPCVPRDTNALPTVGYHYDPLDYAFGGVNLNTNLTFGPGTAVGWFRTSSGWYHAGHGIHIDDRKCLTFAGTLEAPDYWVRANTVQEGGNGNWKGGYGPGGITGWADQYAQDPTRSPVVNLRFTRCSMLAGELGAHFRDDWGYLTVRARDCEILGGAVGGYGLSSYLTNCIFERASVGITEGWYGNEILIRNCTWHGGDLTVSCYATDIPVSVRDCAFDGTLMTMTYQPANSVMKDFDYNAFLQGAAQTKPVGAHDTNVSSFNWQSGVLGNYYQASTALKDKGSRTADQAGLFHYTTTTNQVKEGASPVDIGYHYVAVDGNGKAIDTDNNGVADYLADSNGNGLVDQGETAWLYLPAITQQPVSQTVTEGNDASFGITATGSFLTYRWYRNGTLLSNATTATLTFTNTQLTAAGNYYAVVTNMGGSITSTVAVFTVNPAQCAAVPSGLVSWWQAEGNANDGMGLNPGILQGGTSFGAGKVGQAFNFNGTTANIRVPASTNLDVGLGSGFTIEFWLSPSDLSTRRSLPQWGYPWGYFKMNYPNPGQIHLDMLDIDRHEHIIASPANIIKANLFQHLAVTYDKASGVATIYLNGVVVASQNVGSFTPQTMYDFYLGYSLDGHYAGLLDEVSLYNRALSAPEIQGIYNASIAGKGIPPSITAQPVGQTVTAGSTATFQVSATGIPLSYQWFFNGTALANANQPVLTLPAVQVSQAGDYSVQVTNVAGSVTSSIASLAVGSAPSITSQPVGVVTDRGSDVTFSVGANGTGPLFYQWRFNGADIIGATSSTLTLSKAQVNQQGSYQVCITNIFGSVTSSSALLQLQLVLNGGFETGDFTAWSQSGNTGWTSVNNAPEYVHSGLYSAVSGPTGSLGFLSQGLPTVPGQAYLVSFWLNCPYDEHPNEFVVSWNGITLSDQVDLGVTGWTNPQFVVFGTGAEATLQFGFRDDPSSLVLDDVTVTPVPPSWGISQSQGNTKSVTYGNPATFVAPFNGTYQWFSNSIPILGATASSYTFTPDVSACGSVFNVQITLNSKPAMVQGITLQVLKAPLCGTANDLFAPLYSSLPQFTGQVIGLVNNDNITANCTSPTANMAASGVYPILVTLTDNNNRLSNYDVRLINGALTVGDPSTKPFKVWITQPKTSLNLP